MKILAIAGNARSGKDTLARVIIELLQRDGITAKRFAFADSIKHQLDPILLEKYSISAWTQNDDEKDIIRPELIKYGQNARLDNEYHWVDKTFDEINATDDIDVAVITDLRYPNELEVVHANCGRTLYLTRYAKGQLVEAGSVDEAQYNPELRRLADWRYVVPACSDLPGISDTFENTTILTKIRNYVKY